MTELKTLKDFELDRFYGGTEEGYRVMVRLKAEAIKWIKEIRKDQYLTLNEALVCDTQFLDPERKKEQVIIGKKATEMWIKHFFNITEEELKGGEDNGEN